MNKIKKTICLSLSFVLLLQSGASAVPAQAYRSYLMGLLASRAGDIELAIDEYKRVVSIDKNAALAYKELAQLYVQTGRTNDAFYCAEKLNELQGDVLETQLFLGTFYLMAGYQEKARTAWEKALELDSQNETATVYLAAYYTDKDPQKAIDYWEKFIKQKPDSGGGYYQLGMVQEKTGRLDKARESYQKAVSMGDGGVDAYLSLAQLYEKQDKIGEAVEQYEKYLKEEPDNLAVLLYLGGIYYRTKKYDDALKTFQAAIEYSPKDTNINFWIGLVAEEKRDWALAIKSFESLKKEDESPSILVRLSYYYSNIKDYDTAKSYLEKALALEPLNPNIHYLLGLSYFDAKKYDKAEKHFFKAVSLNPMFEEAYFQLGVLYDLTKRFNKAVPYFEKAIEIKPDYATALNYLGYSYVDRDEQLERAEQMITKALSINPDSGAYIDSMAWVYYKKGDYEKAKTMAVKAASIYTDPVILEHLGDIEFKLGDFAGSWDAYQRSYTLDPASGRVKSKIKDLEKRVLPRTLQRKVLKRAIGNLLQIRTLKLNFTVAAKTSSTSLRNFGLFQYSSPDQWRVDILGSFFAPKIVMIQNKGLSVYPQAVSEEVNSVYLDSLMSIQNYFSSKLLEDFDSDKTIIEEKGGAYKYILGVKTLLIDKDSGAVMEYSDNDDVQLKIPKQKIYEGLYLPLDIRIMMPKQKIAAQIKIKSYMLNKDLGDKTFTVE